MKKIIKWIAKIVIFPLSCLLTFMGSMSFIFSLLYELSKDGDIRRTYKEAKNSFKFWILD